MRMQAEALKSLLQASLDGDLELVYNLLPKLPNQANLSRALINASRNNHKQIVKTLLKDIRTDPTESRNICLFHHINHKNYDIIELLFTDRKVLSTISITHKQPSNIDTLLELAILDKEYNIVSSLLQKQDKFEAWKSLAQVLIQSAASNGGLTMVKLVLNKLSSLQCLFFRSIENRIYDLVEILLSDSSVDPSENDQEALRHCCVNGYFELVHLLLKHQRVDPGVLNNAPLRLAAMNCHFEIVDALLPRVDPSANNNALLCEAVREGYSNFVEYLLDDKRVDPTLVGDFAFFEAVKRGYTGIVALLLKDKRIDPTCYDNEALKEAQKKGFANIYRLLLRDSRVQKSLGK